MRVSLFFLPTAPFGTDAASQCPPLLVSVLEVGSVVDMCVCVVSIYNFAFTMLAEGEAY